MEPEDQHAALTVRVEARRAAYKLYQAASRLVMSTLVRLGVPGAERDDVAQEVLLTALDRWPTYRWEKGSPAQWLRGIAVNHVLKHRRTQARQAAYAERFAREPRPGLPAVEEEVVVRQLEDFIAKLPPLLGRAVWLHEVAEFTFDEIAESEHVAKITAHRRYERGMQKLKEMLEAERTRQGAAFVPVMLAQIFEAERGPELAPEVMERLWQRVSRRGFRPAELPRLGSPCMLARMARYFNTGGACNPEVHYMVPAIGRLPEARGLSRTT